MRGIIADYVRLLRLPGLGGLATPAVFGAVSVGVTNLPDLSLLFLVGVFSVVYGFVLNDYVDVDVDKKTAELHERPLVKGTISPKKALFICFIAVLGAYVTLLIAFQGETITPAKLLAIAAISGAGIMGTIYNIWGKQMVGSDILVAFSQGLIVLFGAWAVASTTMIAIVTLIIFLLTFNQVLYMNAFEGGLKDADHDPMSGVRNIASVLGVTVKGNKLVTPRSFQALGMGIRLFSITLVFLPFLVFGYEYYWWQIALLVLVSLGVLLLTFRLLTMDTFNRKRIRKLISGQTFLRYSLVPIMLMSIIGLLGGIILILFPMIWYIVFTPLSGEKLFQPRM